MVKPYLIILDEPCVGLDAGARENVLVTLQKVLSREDKLSMLYVTHHVEEIIPEFFKILVLKEGKAISQGDTNEVLHSSLLRSVFGVDMELIEKKGRYWPVPI